MGVHWRQILVLGLIHVYLCSSRSNDLRQLLMIDGPRYAWKTDIGTGFICGSILDLVFPLCSLCPLWLIAVDPIGVYRRSSAANSCS